MVEVCLTKNMKAIIDVESLKKVSAYTWHFDGRYAATTFNENGKRKKLYLHRLLQPTFEMVDHKNQNKLDNRLENLRPTNKSKNALNVFGAKGVYFHVLGKRKKRWSSRIKIDGKSKCLGYFLTEKEARAAYLRELRKHV